MWFLFLCLVAVTASAEEPLYKKIGDKVVLTPDSVEYDINNMRWMHGSNVAVEWFHSRFGYDIPLFFGRFKDRATVRISTGEMTIRRLTRGDSGIYTAEINNRVTSKTKLLVISPVRKPTIYISCDPEMTYCVFTCSGSTTGAEPVTYRWTAGEKRWNSTKELKITKEDKERWFSCELKNPVSSRSSEKVFNPFIEKEPLYKKIGDKVVLTPDSEENDINNMKWMYGNGEAMWYRYGGEPLFFGRFKDRGSLDISTGEMTITGLTRDDSGIYTAEINNKYTRKTLLLVISPVPKPTVSVSCDPEMTYCVFTCSGNITGTEPVTYWWTADEKRWPSTKELKITKEEKERWFSCELKNPVSFNSSEEVPNPFMKRDQTWIYILAPLVVVGLVVCIMMIIIIYLIHKYIKEKPAIREQEGRPANRTKQEIEEMLPDFQESSNMKQTSGVGHGYSKGDGLKPQWQYERRSGRWRDFREMTDPPNGCSVTNDDIEGWYQEKPLDKMPFTVNEDEYELDFKEMIQTNLETKTKRMVRRVMLPPECQDVGVSCSDRLL